MIDRRYSQFPEPIWFYPGRFTVESIGNM